MRRVKIVLCFGSWLAALPTLAEEVAPGTVIEASTWEALKDKTFENHRIGDLVPPGLEVLVREHGLKMPLRHSEPLELDPRYWSMTERYAGQVQYDPTARTISGYVAGIPFPDVQRNAVAAGDPEVSATKLMWNLFYANPLFPDNYQIGGDFGAAIQQIDGRKGVDRRQEAIDYKFNMTGRLEEPHIRGNGALQRKWIFMLTSPYDVKGIGGYTERYNDGRPDDVFTYIKSVRRMRRVSGNTWMESLGGGAFLNEDNGLFNIHPTWYPHYKLLGEANMLTVVHGPNSYEERKQFDYNTAPFWNPLGWEWEPREVYVIEGTPPTHHPYGKKIMYMDKEFPSLHMNDVFDKKGERWRVMLLATHPLTSKESPRPGVGPTGIVFIDLQSYRASCVEVNGAYFNNPDLKEDDFSPGAVEKMLSKIK